MVDYEYYHDQYRRVPKNPANIHRELLEYNSTVSILGYNAWSSSIQRRMTTTYIDGRALLGLHERPYTAKDSFPKGKGRRKSSVPCEKKINTGDTYMSLVPAEKNNYDAATTRSEKNRSPLSIATGTQWSTLPDVQRKSADLRNNRAYSATVFDDDNNETKYYGRCATTRANGAWIRRYKSINESQALAHLLRDQVSRDKIVFQKRIRPQSLLFSSPSKSSFSYALIKRKIAQ